MPGQLDLGDHLDEAGGCIPDHLPHLHAARAARANRCCELGVQLVRNVWRGLDPALQPQSDTRAMARRGGGHLVLGVVAAVAGDAVAAAPPGAHVGELREGVHLHPPALQPQSARSAAGHAGSSRACHTVPGKCWRAAVAGSHRMVLQGCCMPGPRQGASGSG